MQLFLFLVGLINSKAHFSAEEQQQLDAIETNGGIIPDYDWQKDNDQIEIRVQKETHHRPKRNNIVQQTFPNTHLKQSVFGEAPKTCGTAVKRLKEGPISQGNQDFMKTYIEWIPWFFGVKFEDLYFQGRDTLYNLVINLEWDGIYTDFDEPRTFTNMELDFFLLNNKWVRLGDTFPDYKLFKERPTVTPSDKTTVFGWSDEITQGGTGDCYFIASASSVAARSTDYIRDAFQETEKNVAGMYTIRLFVRGHPFLTTLDDEVLYDTTKDDLHYANPNKFNPSLWGPLLEKAWAKQMMDYTNIYGGQSYQALRTILGCPVLYYQFANMNVDDKYLWNIVSTQQETYKFPFTVQTLVDGADNRLNQCGFALSHAYAVLKTIVLNDANGDEEHWLYLIRDPNGLGALTTPITKWGPTDTASWTQQYRDQLPFGIDPLDFEYYSQTGSFFIDHADLKRCFVDLEQALMRDEEGFTNNWYDVDGDKGEERVFSFIVPPLDGPMYITVESYVPKMIPYNCFMNSTYVYPTKSVLVQVDDTIISKTEQRLDQSISVIPITSYVEGDTMTITVQYNWNWQRSHQDYSIVIYSKHNIKIVDEKGQTNQLHYDGQKPSGFKNSFYSTEQKDWTPGDQKPPVNIWELIFMTGGTSSDTFWTYLNNDPFLVMKWW